MKYYPVLHGDWTDPHPWYQQLPKTTKNLGHILHDFGWKEIEIKKEDKQ